MENLTGTLIEWGAANRAADGERDSGDLCVVRPFPDGILIAALDGAGHGSEALAAAKAAAQILESHAEESAVSLMRRCHESLRGTRGAAISMASFHPSKGVMTWLGVGNVEGVLLRTDRAARRATESLMLHRGVVGHQLPQLAGKLLHVAAGDTLIFTTDGVAHGFAKVIPPGASTERVANSILARHAKATDDALVVVARVKESGS